MVDKLLSNYFLNSTQHITLTFLWIQPVIKVDYRSFSRLITTLPTASSRIELGKALPEQGKDHVKIYCNLMDRRTGMIYKCRRSVPVLVV